MSQQYVLDTNILIQAYVREVHTFRVQTLLQGLENPEPDELIIPEFTLVECGNVLWQHVRRHGMPPTTATHAVQALLNLPLSVHTAASLLPRGFDIGLTHSLAVYDCIHIALAELLQCPLITVDAKQAKAAEALGVQLKSITDFPEFVEPET